jgi:hypothetical protein
VSFVSLWHPNPLFVRHQDHAFAEASAGKHKEPQSRGEQNLDALDQSRFLISPKYKKKGL